MASVTVKVVVNNVEYTEVVEVEGLERLTKNEQVEYVKLLKEEVRRKIYMRQYNQRKSQEVLDREKEWRKNYNKERRENMKALKNKLLGGRE